MDINGTSYCFLNIYAPNLENQNEQLIFWNKVKLILYDRQGSNVIIGGDLNIFLDGQLDKSPQNTKLYRAIEDFKQTMDDYNLVDIWRINNENRKQFTWRRFKPTLIQSRIDYWLIPGNMIYELKRIGIIPGFRSDHNAINLKFIVKETQKRGPGFWKFPTYLLKDDSYIENIRNLINDTKTENLELNPPIYGNLSNIK